MAKNILDGITDYSVFSYWFVPVLEMPNAWSIVDHTQPEAPIGILDEGTAPGSQVSISLAEAYNEQADDVLAAFVAFKQRPEYFVTRPVENINSLDQESLIREYEMRLIGLVFDRVVRAGKNPDDNVKAAMNCIEWLKVTDFYNAPGSTQYHDSEPSGLLKHSLRVFNHIIRLRYDDAFKCVDMHSAALVALTHDWCKIGLYEMYMRNVKNENTGKWEQVPSYRRNQQGIPLGHGVSSMFITSKFFKLSTDEALALRWHMGHWNVANNEVNELQLANETTPLVHLLQFADQLAITKYAHQ